MVKNFLKIISISLISSFALSGCIYPFLYKADIQQGNVIQDEQISQLKLGMTKLEVKALFGTPMLHPEENSHWLYIYYHKPGYGQAYRKKIHLTFQEGKLIHFQAE